MKFLFLAFTLSCITLPLLYGMTPNKQLFIAAGTGNIQQAQEALNAGADVNAQNDFGSSILHTAVSNNRFNIVKFLVGSGAYVDIQDAFSSTPLHFASDYARSDIAKFLLEKGANINARDLYGQTPLHQPIWKGDIAGAKLLLDAGADINAQDYSNGVALRGFNTYVLSNTMVILIQKYSALLEQVKLRPTKELLTQAINLGYVHAVKLLLKAGIKPEVRDLNLIKEEYDREVRPLYEVLYICYPRPLYKESYAAIGRMLLQHLRLTGELQAPQHNLALLQPNTTEHTYGPISKSGITQIGLPRDIIHTIASFTH